MIEILGQFRNWNSKPGLDDLVFGLLLYQYRTVITREKCNSYSDYSFRQFPCAFGFEFGDGPGANFNTKQGLSNEY
jgi:hypothetical protein